MDLWENFFEQNWPIRSRSNFCGLCNIQVTNKTKHLQMIHGWVRCTFCRNIMDVRFLDAHLDRKHEHKPNRRNTFRGPKREYDRNAIEQHDQNYDSDEPKTPPHQPDYQAKR